MDINAYCANHFGISTPKPMTVEETDESWTKPGYLLIGFGATSSLYSLSVI